MELFVRLLARAAIWVRRPPPPRVAAAIFGAVAIAVLIVLVERGIGWPDWATAERWRRLPPPP